LLFAVHASIPGLMHVSSGKRFTLRGIVERMPLLFPALIMLVALLMIAPWGNYPLNDDWQYARATKILAATHRFVVDTPIAPSLIGQSLLALPLIWSVGFSHTALRLLTLVVAFVGLWSIDRLLRYADVDRPLRTMALLVVFFNPLFLNLSLSFMTEIYGYVPTLVGATLWFWERRRRDAEDAEQPVVRLWVAAAVALLVAASFWIRQFSVCLFPALLGSAVLRLLVNRQWRRLGRSLPALLLAVALFFAGVVAYFPWVKATANYRQAFDRPLSQMTHFDLNAWEAGLSGALPYVTAFCCPLLLLFRWRRIARPSVLIAAVCLLGFGIYGGHKFEEVGITDFHPWYIRHKVFPFFGNIIANANVGPITLPDVFRDGRPHPQWTKSFWMGVHTALVVLGLSWIPFVRNLVRTGRGSQATLKGELQSFCLLWAIVALALTIQAYQLRLFDRYFLPVVLAAILLIAEVASRSELASPVWQRIIFAVALAPVAWFSVAGVHDYFRWNDVRWQLVRGLMAKGISPTVIQGGYEVNGWLVTDDKLKKRGPEGCIGACRCSFPLPEWSCLDESYRIAMNRLPGYSVLEAAPTRFWLTPSPLLYVLQRQP
jgi:hypothetical protein